MENPRVCTTASWPLSCNLESWTKRYSESNDSHMREKKLPDFAIHDFFCSKMVSRWIRVEKQGRFRWDAFEGSRSTRNTRRMLRDTLSHTHHRDQHIWGICRIVRKDWKLDLKKLVLMENLEKRLKYDFREVVVWLSVKIRWESDVAQYEAICKDLNILWERKV